MRRILQIFLILLWIQATGTPHAAEKFSAIEIAMLPAYCQVKQQFQLPGRQPGADVRQWAQVLGPNVTMHMHHYCGGLAWLRRAEFERSGSRQRAKYVEKALNGINYLLNAHNLPPQTPIMPDILVNRGKALFLRGEPGEAISMARKALAIKGDFIGAYELLIDVLLGLKQEGEALAVAEEGLRRAPDSKRLERRYLDLGGKLPLPGVKADTPAPTASPSAEGASATTPDAKADAGSAEASPSSATGEPGGEGPSAGESDAGVAPKKRSCRFCP